MTEPVLTVQNSGDSDSVSFDHILKKLDQNDKLQLQRMESYNYELASKLKQVDSNKENKDAKLTTLKTVAEKERGGQPEGVDFL